MKEFVELIPLLNDTMIISGEGGREWKLFISAHPGNTFFSALLLGTGLVQHIDEIDLKDR